jgi:hypothetical protein
MRARDGSNATGCGKTARRFVADRFTPRAEKIFPLESVAALDTVRGSDVLGFKSSLLTVSICRALVDETWNH